MSGGGTTQGGQSFSTSNTTSTSAPSPVVQPILKKGVDFLSGYFDKNPNAPALYPGSFTAAPNPATTTANQTYYDLGVHGLGYGIDEASRGNISDTLKGKYLDPGANPYLQKYLRAGFDVQNEEFNNSVLPNLRAQFAGSGRTGSGADFNTAMRGVDSLARAQAGAAAQAEAGAYSDERGRQFQAQGLLPSLQGIDLNRAAAMARAGQGSDAIEQQRVNEAIYRDSYRKTGDLDYWSNIASRALGMYPGGTTQGTGTNSGYSTMYGGGGGAGSWLGAGMGIAGLGLQALPLFGFSDARLKDVEGRVGYTDEGLPLYLYKYKGDDQPRIGPMAQEVERVRPDAVATHPSGFKMVDYRKAMPPGGLL